jgi:hypothetical protein
MAFFAIHGTVMVIGFYLFVILLGGRLRLFSLLLPLPLRFRFRH